MTQYDQVVAATSEEFGHYIGTHPMLLHLTGGSLTRGEYIAYLRETYHMVRHTPRMLALAGARCEDDRRGLRNWFIEQTEEENNHDLFCIKDLRNFGENPETVLAGQPLPGAWALVCQNYFMATYGNPAGILGVASITEGLGASTAGSMADLLTSHYGYGSDAVTFLRSHSGFDAKHLDETRRAINELVHSREDLNAVIQGRHMTIYYYAQMFNDCLAHPYPAAAKDDDTAEMILAVAAE
ncbi:TenA family transcriptional regulator [Sphingomonas qilianensis]|uniref:Iron-containing redox enzyme family protein n=1 Tax=Sphingomonas qilianensis TaxID=1736690 RepID=A0ABU9XWL8_9SPHN